jgi:2-methylcitrate dehydratase PrpD
MTSILETMATWIGNYSSTEEQRALAQHAIIDTLACMVVGADDDVTKTVRNAQASSELPSGKARLVGGGSTIPALAAMINGTAAHAIDFDDNFKPGMSHASAVIVPAILAVADQSDLSGRAVVDAYLVALQAQAFIGSGIVPSHYIAGWHGTSTVGSVGTAAGIAHLLGMDPAGAAAAMSLGVSMASGTKGQFGSSAKPFHAGLAARNSVEAAYLARAGLAGHLDIIERDQGFLEMFGGKSPKGYDTDAIAATAGHVIETVGVMPKRFACCGSTHLVVDMLLDLLKEQSLSPDNIETIEIKVRIANFRNLPFDAPTNEMEARFSMHYCVARTLRTGRLAVDEFTPANVAKYASDPLLGMVSMRHYSAEEEALRDGLPHTIRLGLKNGSMIERSRALPKGSLADPFTAEDRQIKFLDCCRTVKEAQPILARLETLADAKELSFVGPLFGH